MSTATQPEFGKWRARLWPVHSFELKKLLPMLMLLFLILFNYTILRDTKDSLIVTAPGSGAETIAFLKFWGVLPMAAFFMILYSKMSNIMSKPKVFYSIIGSFGLFFALFAIVIYPMRDMLHPNAFCDRMQEILPAGLNGLVAMVRNWTFSLFYIMSELWGSVALSLLFWGFANDTTRVSEAKRFYALFTTGANVALIMSGACVRGFSNIRSRLPEGVDAWQVTLNWLMAFVFISAALTIGIYWWINKKVLTDPRFYDASEVKKKKDKPKLSMKESFLYLAKSKYIGCLCVLVLAYGLCINLVEITWKGQLKLQYPNPNEYNAFMGLFSMITGGVTILMTFFVGGNILRRFGWGVGAQFTPTVLVLTGVAFFSYIIFRNPTASVLPAVILGMIQNILSKASKYALFDPTKEMAYIPLDQEAKVKGKAAIDVVGARLGKSGGSVIQQGLLVFVAPSMLAITPYIGVIFIVVIGGWMLSARSLNKQFLDLTAKREEEQKAAAADTAEPAPAT